jgi:hypothetical protein
LGSRKYLSQPITHSRRRSKPLPRISAVEVAAVVVAAAAAVATVAVEAVATVAAAVAAAAAAIGGLVAAGADKNQRLQKH